MTTMPPSCPAASLDPATLDMLHQLQRDSFAYFVTEVDPETGLVRDKTAPGWPASIAAVGMALTVYPIGVERGFMTRAEAVLRTLTVLRFFIRSEQSAARYASGYKGFYYHFLDMQTGARVWDCELSSIDTALLVAGMLAAAAYFSAGTPEEAEIRTLADQLYRRIDWPWMLTSKGTLSHGWRPRRGFLRWHWEGYDEALILYVLALASPTFPIARVHYDAWSRTYEWKNVYGIEYLYAGPLFIHQMSHLWLDLRGIRDDFMRAHDLDYFENSRRATHVQRQYAIRNPLDFPEYGELCWGITASDGPGPARRRIAGVQRKLYDYVARAAPYGPDDGTLAPWAVAASLPFAPEIVLPSIRHYHGLHLCEADSKGFKASFSTVYRHDDGSRWVSPYHFGINEGPTIIMVENYLCDSPWRLMRTCAPVRDGLLRAGFRGGWLDGQPPRKA